MRLLLGAVVSFLVCSSAAFASPITWNFTASNNVTGDVVFDSTSSSYAPNSFITLSTGITSFSFTDGNTTWTQDDDVISFDIQFGATTSPANLHSVNIHVEEGTDSLTISNFPSAQMPNGQLQVAATGQQSANDGAFFTGLGSALVPEPASIALWSILGAGLTGFVCYRRRAKG